MVCFGQDDCAHGDLFGADILVNKLLQGQEFR